MRPTPMKNFKDSLGRPPGEFWRALNEEIMIVEQVAEAFGVTRWAILKRCRLGTIPAYKYGKRWYFIRSEIMRHMKGTVQ
jgi:excisionase family DNA binding protein